ncbi:MAG TPA: glycoside hydrolase family 32 protein [Anaerolineae bacterium]|nr:glycoside hydrolase family 32 protein [Anaerolineae bacterium]
MEPEAYRPTYHFTPPQHWMNDPNGLVYADGVYHLYYQHNPYAAHWGHMSWGHAISRDLVHWEHLPIALWEEPEQGYTIFSGSVVIDRSNTAGFGAGALVAIYTADARERRLETVHIATSLDGGRTFTQYAGNPVIDGGESKFGDPKVFWHAESAKWVMVNICGNPQGHVVLVGSADLRTWTRLSEFHAPEAAPHVWECPDLFPLAVDGDPAHVKWVLKTNCVQFGGNTSGTRYFIGDFDGVTFTQTQALGAAFTTDQGAIYAEVTYNDAPGGERVLVGWLRQPPREDRPWTGAQSLPRVLTLHTAGGGLELRQAPHPALRALRGASVRLDDAPLSGDTPLDVDVSGRALEIAAEFAPGDAACGLRLTLAEGEAVIGYAEGEAFVERPGQPRLVAPLSPRDGRVKLHVLFDQDIVEVFGGDGETGMTTWLDFGAEYRGLAVFGDRGARATVEVWLIGTPSS